MSRAAEEAHVAELAGGLRTVVNGLAHVLRGPVARRGVTPTRLTALATLERRGPLRPGDLASRLNITPASMSRLVDVLEEGRWISRAADPADRRAWLLSLSDHGRDTLAELRRESTGRLADDIRSLTEEQRDALAAALPVLAELVEKGLEAEHGTGPRTAG